MAVIESYNDNSFLFDGLRYPSDYSAVASGSVHAILRSAGGNDSKFVPLGSSVDGSVPGTQAALITALSGLLRPGQPVREVDLPTINLKRAYGITGDASDQTAKIQAAIAAIGTSGIYEFPFGPITISDTIAWPTDVRVRFNGTEFRAAAGLENKPMMVLRSDSVFKGYHYLNGQSLTGVIGQQLGGDFSCQQAIVESVQIRNCDIGQNLIGAVGKGVYNNKFGWVRSRNNATNLRIYTNGSTPYEVNDNVWDRCTLQISTVDALVVDGGDGNVFSSLECQSNTGDAIDLKRAIGFTVNGGWIEGNTINLRIADNPAVQSVYLCASVDTALDSADTKFVYTASTNRAVHLRTATNARMLGRTRFEDVQLGAYGVVANDQNNNPLSIAGGINFYRKTSGGYFYFAGQSGLTGFYVTNGSGTMMADLTATRMELTGSLNLVGTTTSFLQGIELAADPSAPSANAGKLYFRDNGSGKTQLCVRFNTGAVQVLATEP